jgi:hypothetical protein
MKSSLFFVYKFIVIYEIGGYFVKNTEYVPEKTSYLHFFILVIFVGTCYNMEGSRF